jgi:hypothetical protein
VRVDAGAEDGGELDVRVDRLVCAHEFVYEMAGCPMEFGFCVRCYVRDWELDSSIEPPASRRT